MTPAEIQHIKKAIEKEQWKKDMYVFACDSMQPYGYYRDMKKAELIEKFYQLIPLHFNSIRKFSTFRHLKNISATAENFCIQQI